MVAAPFTVRMGHREGQRQENKQPRQCRTGCTRRVLFNPNLHLIIISNLFPQFLMQIRTGTVHTPPLINDRMLNGGGPTCGPGVIYYHTQSRARMAHLVRVCAGVYHSILLSVFADHRGHGCLPQTADIFSLLHSARLLLGRGVLHGSGRMAYGQTSH